VTTTATDIRTGSVRANGIDIHYVETGQGDPLVLLHGGMVSTSPVWAGIPISYHDHLGGLGERFRVIAPDTRSGGRTAHDASGDITFDLLADDVAALIAALGLDRPAVAGFSEGGITATVLGIRHPALVGAIVNDAGFDLFDPEAPTLAMMRQMLGGSPDAPGSDPDAAERWFGQSPETAHMFELMKADQDAGQGEGHWREYLRLAFARTTTPSGYTFADLGRVPQPTLILVGDRDRFCTPEDGVTAYRALGDGELAVLPDTGHVITAAGVDATADFVARRRSA
jgi:pimeloyl-ACP methyl ester carboxylesterase